MSLVVTFHAAARYRLHHPEAEEANLLAAWDAGVDVAPEVARELLGRRRVWAGAFRVTPDRRGLLVEDSGRIVTYLRFQSTQERLAHRFWPLPEDELPSAPKAERIRRMEPTGVLRRVAHLVHPATMCFCSQIRIREKLRALCGSSNAARRALYLGRQREDGIWTVSVDGAEHEVAFGRIDGVWLAGLREEMGWAAEGAA